MEKRAQPVRLPEGATEIVSPEGKRMIDWGLAGTLLGGLGSGTISLLHGHKAKKALKHALMGGALTGLTGAGLVPLLTKIPWASFAKVPQIPYLSENVWEHPEKSIWRGEEGGLFDAPSERKEIATGNIMNVIKTLLKLNPKAEV